jgi:hypothetical protein
MGETAMETAEILEKARAGGEPPQGWIVLPLLRNKVAIGIVGWIFGVIVGFGLFALLAPVMVPYNYQNGAFEALFSTIILGMMLFIGGGSVWQIIVDTRRLLQADEHIIIITPEDFVMQDGNKIIHVPLVYVRYVTARGTPPPDRTVPKETVISDTPRSGENITGFLFGRGLTRSGRRQRRKRKHGPTMLAFVDCRTDTEVKVANDASYGDPFAIAATLKEYAASTQRIT